FGYCQRPSDFSIISRWEDYNLQIYLAENNLEWIEKLSIARGIANALNYCHKKDILHYDIRTYNSSERIRGERYTKASEIYSFAMVLWEIQHHELLYNKLTSEEISEKILKGEYPPQKPRNSCRIPKYYRKSMGSEERSNMEKLYNRLDILDSRNLLNQNVELISYNKEEESIDDNSIEGLESPRIIGKIPDIARGIKYHQNKQYKRAWKIFEEYERWHEGTKGTPNSRASVSFLKLAAESGHADAQYYYALAIINYGTAAKEHRDKDRTKIALDYLKSSAKQDHPNALKMLGGIINKGNIRGMD
ncbi:kinase-like domain-containing protein, partial [Rhizophagus diaphanus]